ncbi:hypothetical protein P9250_29975 [Caballeronia sp. LP006]|nr:hypothetical protein [Caballeronia sp. LP006]MDR5832095.1 hypothetical protein [Caballeronia sp. LP006]
MVEHVGAFREIDSSIEYPTTRIVDRARCAERDCFEATSCRSERCGMRSHDRMPAVETFRDDQHERTCVPFALGWWLGRIEIGQPEIRKTQAHETVDALFHGMAVSLGISAMHIQRPETRQIERRRLIQFVDRAGQPFEQADASCTRNRAAAELFSSDTDGKTQRRRAVGVPKLRDIEVDA